MVDISPHHMSSLTKAHDRLDQHSARLKVLEISRAEERVRARNIEASLAKIHDAINWVLRLVIGAIIAGVLAWVLQGGLNVP